MISGSWGLRARWRAYLESIVLQSDSCVGLFYGLLYWLQTFTLTLNFIWVSVYMLGYGMFLSILFQAQQLINDGTMGINPLLTQAPIWTPHQEGKCYWPGILKIKKYFALWWRTLSFHARHCSELNLKNMIEAESGFMSKITNLYHLPAASMDWWRSVWTNSIWTGNSPVCSSMT